MRGAQPATACWAAVPMAAPSKDTHRNPVDHTGGNTPRADGSCSHESNRRSREMWDARLQRPGQTADAPPSATRPGNQGTHWSGSSHGPVAGDGPADMSRTRWNGDGTAWEPSGRQMMGYHHCSGWIQNSSYNWPFPCPMSRQSTPLLSQLATGYGTITPE